MKMSFVETRFASSGDDAAAPFIMAAAAMTVLRLGAFAPQATRLRRSAGSTATRPPARRACAVKAAGDGAIDLPIDIMQVFDAFGEEGGDDE